MTESKRKPGRPPSDGKSAMSDTLRAALYRNRQKASGGKRLTLNASEADLMRSVLRQAIKLDNWTAEEREQLADLRQRLAR